MLKALLSAGMKPAAGAACTAHDSESFQDKWVDREQPTIRGDETSEFPFFYH